MLSKKHIPGLYYIILIGILGLCILNPANAQIDSTKKVSSKKPVSHSPKKAAILSAIIPGAGQIYNKKYWKAPIAWAIVGGAIYYLNFNQKVYIDYRDNYRIRVDNDPNTFDAYLQLSKTQLLGQRNNAKQTRDLSILILTIAYAVNIIDANVDGHLYNFDVSNDLSLRFNPVYYQASGLGISCNIQHKVKPVYAFR